VVSLTAKLALILIVFQLMQPQFCIAQNSVWEQQMQAGMSARNSTNYVLAESHFLSALEIAGKYFSDDERLAYSLSATAALYIDMGRFVDAEPLLLQSLEMKTRIFGPTTLEVADDHLTLAAVYFLQNNVDFDKGEAHALSAISISEKALGPNHKDIPFLLGELGSFYEEQGRYAEAEKLYRKALEIHRTNHGDVHSKVAAYLDHIANTYRARELYSESIQIYQQSIDVEDKLGDTFSLLASVNNQGRAYMEWGKYSEAGNNFNRAVNGLKQRDDPDSIALLAGVHVNMAQNFLYQENYQEAEYAAKKGIEIWDSQGSPDNFIQVIMNITLANAYKGQKRFSDAEILLLDSLAYVESTEGTDGDSVKLIQDVYDQVIEQKTREEEQ
jgi:tetratricopeptide (TPR) repeat protein